MQSKTKLIIGIYSKNPGYFIKKKCLLFDKTLGTKLVFRNLFPQLKYKSQQYESKLASYNVPKEFIFIFPWIVNHLANQFCLLQENIYTLLSSSFHIRKKASVFSS